jgi:hypothetical protein
MISSREQLAALAHDRWAGWMKYLFEKSIERDDGYVEIPAHLVTRWMRQMNTAYVDLPESEKESDRAEADRILSAFLDNKVPKPHSRSNAKPTKRPR